MRSQPKPFVVEIKSSRRIASRDKKSIWGDHDLKIQDDKSEVEAGVATDKTEGRDE